jgi:two-component system sensor histidine kinase QseC
MRGLPRSLQGRLLLGLLGAVLLVWGAAALATWRDARHELDELLDSHLAQAAALLVARQSGEIDDDEHGIDSPQLHRYAPKVAFQVWHAGRLALRSSNAPAAPMLTPLALQALVPLDHAEREDREDRDRHDDASPAQGLRTGLATVQIAGTAWRVFTAQGAERDIQVFVGEQISSRASILWAVLRGTLWPMALALPLLALAVWWAVRQATQPLRALSHALAQRDPRALEPVAIVDPPAEMAPLLTALNRLFERITERAEAERRFTADAAHELRTPIAAIRAQAQVALAETDNTARIHALRATLAGCDRATRLVAQLLTLSRLEAGAAPIPAVVDLAALARRVAGELAPSAIARHQTLGLDATTACPVRGDETLLAVLLRNLIDNALRYSADGAQVSIVVQPAGKQILLQVDDSGPGMTEADRQRLGERFFRVLGSSQGGSGLGWSIVRRIAEAHRATIALTRSAALGGLAVQLLWPGMAEAEDCQP